MRTDPTGVPPGAAASRATDARPERAPSPAPNAARKPGDFRARLDDAAPIEGTKRAPAPRDAPAAPAPPPRGVRHGETARGARHGETAREAEPLERGERRARPRRAEADEVAGAELPRFHPPPAVLSPLATPHGPASVARPVAPPELAAMAERLLTRVRVGRADGGAVLRLRVDGRGRGDVDVELRATPEGLTAAVAVSDGDRGRAGDWAARLEEALRARGLDVGAVDVG